jgi:DNA-binding NarL/FixJ family response regulator
VHIVSNVRLLREGLSSTLAADARIEIVGACALDEAARAILTRRPDVLLLDVISSDSLELPRQMRTVAPSLRTVAFAVADAEADVLACAEAGISGYVAQDGSAEDLVVAILRAVGGELVCPPRIAALLFARVAALSDRSFGGAFEPLTPRERQIAGLIANGLPNKSIARELSLAPATIKNHVHNILQKLSLQRRGELIAFWRRSGSRAAAGVSSL